MIAGGKKNSGQSMMEMVFSIGLLITSISAIIALNASNINSQKQSEFLIVANNLAREGIEVVRHLRDSNLLSEGDWDDGLKTAGAYRPVFDPKDNTWSLVPFSSTDTGRLYLTGIGAYSYVETNNFATPYFRRLDLQFICLDISENPGKGTEIIKDECDNSNEKKIGLKIRSVVTWTEKDRPHQVMIEDLLYDWK